MAPRKQAVSKKPKKASTVKKTENRVVKRPARGYHKFKTGMLNVTPKGGEKELVRSNQNSPLLRLPPEIRNRVWMFVLGGMTLRSTFVRIGSKSKPVRRILPPMIDRNNGFPLLRTCRQIYHETALLPFTSNIFAFISKRQMSIVLKKFKVYQLQQITSIQLEIDKKYFFHMWERSLTSTKRSHASKFQVLPALKHIRICYFDYYASTDSLAEEDKNWMLKRIKPFIAGRDLDISFEVMESD